MRAQVASIRRVHVAETMSEVSEPGMEPRQGWSTTNSSKHSACSATSENLSKSSFTEDGGYSSSTGHIGADDPQDKEQVTPYAPLWFGTASR
jgi:hypothetical protein